ncbi:hypothetical protein L3X38_034371 [Prunus dulcis]|uniref:Malectin-like domain-containing protein n=1 Tax=Prunus dulcis TaxID=3755 RepID=A0AAD4YWT3_PRUDU|nr:hypothetical protein L3X38_034371 [Prunus dulcis]
METLHNHNIHIPLFSLLFFLFHFSSLHFLSLAYEQPDKYFVNCGSKADANLNGRVFTADSSSGFLCSEESRAIESTNQSPRYAYQETSPLLLSDLPSSSSSSSAPTHQFFFFVQPRSSFFFLIQRRPYSSISSSSFFIVGGVGRTTYRVNVGGQKITPDNDTIWRNWDPDHICLSNSNSAEDFRPSSSPTLIRQYSVESHGFVGADSDFIAPDLVYLTAKVMTGNIKGLSNPFNITWSFNVSADARHLVRVHFCDIIGPPGNLVFNLYSNGNFITKVGGPYFSFNSLYQPFYYDFVLSSNGSEFINISIGPSIDTTTTNNSFLNGLEMLEIIEGPTLSNHPASVCNMKGPLLQKRQKTTVNHRRVLRFSVVVESTVIFSLINHDAKSPSLLMTGPDPISALESEPSPVRVRHLANVGHNDLFTLSANKYCYSFT